MADTEADTEVDTEVECSDTEEAEDLGVEHMVRML